MATPEGKVKAMISKAFKDAQKSKEKLWFFMPVGGRFGKAGIPDYIGCYNGKMFAIEAKSATGTPTALQARELESITNAGALAFVVSSQDELNNAIKTITGESK
jgi:penicillin-binding protein-related factor A (putative recombinase)